MDATTSSQNSNDSFGPPGESREDAPSAEPSAKELLYCLTTAEERMGPGYPITSLGLRWLAANLPELMAARSALSSLRREREEARKDSERLTELQRLCGMRRWVKIETNSTGTVIHALLDTEGHHQQKGRGAGLRDAIDDMSAPSKEGSQSACEWCQRGYVVDSDGTHYIPRGEHGMATSLRVHCAVLVPSKDVSQ